MTLAVKVALNPIQPINQSDFKETSQKLSLHGPLQKLSAFGKIFFYTCETSGCYGKKTEKYRKSFKNFLSTTVRCRVTKFGIYLRVKDTYQNPSNYGSGVKNLPHPLRCKFKIGLCSESCKYLLVPQHIALGFSNFACSFM